MTQQLPSRLEPRLQLAFRARLTRRYFTCCSRNGERGICHLNRWCVGGNITVGVDIHRINVSVIRFKAVDDGFLPRVEFLRVHTFVMPDDCVLLEEALPLKGHYPESVGLAPEAHGGGQVVHSGDAPDTRGGGQGVDGGGVDDNIVVVENNVVRVSIVVRDTREVEV